MPRAWHHAAPRAASSYASERNLATENATREAKRQQQQEGQDGSVAGTKVGAIANAAAAAEVLRKRASLPQKVQLIRLQVCGLESGFGDCTGVDVRAERAQVGCGQRARGIANGLAAGNDFHHATGEVNILESIVGEIARKRERQQPVGR